MRRVAALERVASPRSRGWTLRARDVLARIRGFPALAGMDPNRLILDRMLQRLPRARGDGPDRARLYSDIQVASPRSRGWTGVRRGG